VGVIGTVNVFDENDTGPFRKPPLRSVKLVVCFCYINTVSEHYLNLFNILGHIQNCCFILRCPAHTCVIASIRFVDSIVACCRTCPIFHKMSTVSALICSRFEKS
jgi:hypothetical protein